jgi:hypothetical protein
MPSCRRKFLSDSLGLYLAGFAWPAISPTSQVDQDLLARRRLFSPLGPGLRAIKHAPSGNYYLLTSPNVGVTVFDGKGKQLNVVGAPASEPAANKPASSAIAFGVDCDIDEKGNLYVADRGSNRISVFSHDGTPSRSMPVSAPLSVAVLPEGEIAVSTERGAHLITVFSPTGRVAREIGEAEPLAGREDLNRYASLGKLAADAQGKLYYGYAYLPEPLVRQYDRIGYAGLDFQFTGLDAYPEAQAARKEILRLEKKVGPISLQATLTAFGVDRVNGDVWMGLHNTLLHFDKDANRRSEYRVYTKDGARLEAGSILVEEERLLIGNDPLGVHEFPRPDRKPV